ncbi:MAG: helix-turn-helix family protein [Bacillales bacterium]|jgi:transcriptional regulator with XRE-family HTH domain|nr:helix-turn-helix family protein [Bacillales bacterium]
MTKVGTNIKNYRELKKLTQEELARRARLGVATIEKFENDELLPDTQQILKISTVLDVPASELLETDLSQQSIAIDSEMEILIQEIGVKRAKLILRKAKEFSEEDLLKIMQVLYEIKYGNENEN